MYATTVLWILHDRQRALSLRILVCSREDSAGRDPLSPENIGCPELIRGHGWLCWYQHSTCDCTRWIIQCLKHRLWRSSRIHRTVVTYVTIGFPEIKISLIVSSIVSWGDGDLILVPLCGCLILVHLVDGHSYYFIFVHGVRHLVLAITNKNLFVIFSPIQKRILSLWTEQFCQSQVELNAFSRLFKLGARVREKEGEEAFAWGQKPIWGQRFTSS